MIKCVFCIFALCLITIAFVFNNIEKEARYMLSIDSFCSEYYETSYRRQKIREVMFYFKASIHRRWTRCFELNDAKLFKTFGYNFIFSNH